MILGIAFALVGSRVRSPGYFEVGWDTGQIGPEEKLYRDIAL